MYRRILNIDSVLERKSVFLFGPRQTGKSTYLRQKFPKALYINLLSKKIFEDYSLKANALESDLELYQRKSSSSIVIVDEIQKLPLLLDEIHHQIELHKKWRFILTGSSARKLKRSGVNLLGGRASWRNMFPLTYPEMGMKFKTVSDLEYRLLVGGLPSIYDSANPFEDLDDYIQLYLNEEIKAEGFVRNHEGFHRFLLTSALVNAQQINFTEIGSDAQVPPRTIHDYFTIIEDTLIGSRLLPFIQTPSRKAVASTKFYLFDTGLVNALLRRTSLSVGTKEFGDLFEHFVIFEIKAFLSYFNKKSEIFYWRSTSKFEVDLIIKSSLSKMWAVEIKGKERISSKDSKGLIAFAEDYPKVKKIVVCLSGRRFIDENKIEIIPVFAFLESLWSDEFGFE